MKCYVFLVCFIALLSCKKNDIIRVVEETYPDGKEKKVCLYKEKDGKKICVGEIMFYENGNKMYEGSYNENKERHGVWTYWYENGIKWSEGEFKNGKADGFRRVYHKNGQLFYSGKYKDGKEVGKWKYFDENGVEITPNK